MSRSIAGNACWLALLWMVSGAGHAATQVLIVAGLGGDDSYAQEFALQADAYARQARELTADGNIDVIKGAAASRDAVRVALKSLAGTLQAGDQLLLYLIGHGSYDGQEYKFNLPGPDLAGPELAQLLNAIPAANQLVVITGSASGALADLLQKPGRVLIAATRNGNEKNATRFGAALLAALADSASDADKNGVISAQEAFDAAARRVKESYEHDKKLATEHAHLVGATAGQFTMARLAVPATVAGAAGAAGAAAPAGASGPSSGPLAQERQRLNESIEALRLKKTTLPEAEYNQQLEALLLKLAEVQDRIDAAGGGANAP